MTDRPKTDKQANSTFDNWNVLILMLKICLNISENTDFFSKYRPILAVLLKRSVLQTKIIFTDHCVITGKETAEAAL